MGKKVAIGVDLGGTNFKFGLVEEDGNILKKDVVEVAGDRSINGVIALIVSEIKKLVASEHDVVGLGIGMPGIVDRKKGIIYKSPNYFGWVDAPVLDELKKYFKMPIVLDNDANMVALGEHWLGAGKGVSNFLMVTLGTGIGGGWIINDKIFHGDRGFAGEIGHIIIDFNGVMCNCGNRGCLEAYASATGLKRMIKDWEDVPEKSAFVSKLNSSIESISPIEVFKFASDGDIFAGQVWKKFGAYLGAGLASLVNAMGIETIIIGGGLTKAWDFFIDPTLKEFNKRTYKEIAEKVRIKRTELLDDAGVLGAAKVIFSC